MTGTGTERRREADHLVSLFKEFKVDQAQRHEELKASLRECHTKIDKVQDTHNDFLQGNANVGYIFSPEGPFHTMEKDVRRHNNWETGIKFLVGAVPIFGFLVGMKEKVLTALHLK